MSTLRQAQKAETRQKILDAAYLVFSEKGFLAPTSLIAKEAGVSHGTVFVHFPTLDGLLASLLSDFGGKIGERLHLLAKRCDGIESFLTEHLNILEEYEPFYARLVTGLNLLPGEAKTSFLLIQSAAAFHFGSIAQREMEEGRIKKLPADLLFNTWHGLVHYYLQNAEFFAKQGESVLKRRRAELLSCYLRLISIESEETTR